MINVSMGEEHNATAPGNDINSLMESWWREEEEEWKKKGGGRLLLWKLWEEEIEEWIDLHQMVDIDIHVNEGNVVEAAEPPPDIVLPLLRFQKEWLAWALKQEQSEVRGGILADEMGMGKTIQAISLVLSARGRRSSRCGSYQISSLSSSFSKIKTTLVICPPAAITQWENEIGKFTSAGSATVLLYHGTKRSNWSKHFSEYDFVLTTYPIVEADYRKSLLPPKQRCQWCGVFLLPKKMADHLKLVCGPRSTKTVEQSKQVKKKYSIVEDRINEIEIGRGTNKADSEGRIRSSSNSSIDVEESSSSEKSALHSVMWDRIILDEAHYIKDRRSKTTKAVLALESSYKWALSGTPFQNCVGEIYSLIRFLQISPYSYYFCTDCECKFLDYSEKCSNQVLGYNSCKSCGHFSIRHFCWWNKYMANQIRPSNEKKSTRAMILLRQKLLKSILLRRTKEARAADLALPTRTVSLRWNTLDDQEADYYRSLYARSQAQFNIYVGAGTLMKNYAHILAILTRLRQAVDHPYLVEYSGDGDKFDNVEDCSICHETAEDPVVASCEHTFCKACFLNFFTGGGQACPSCSEPLTVELRTKENAGKQSATVEGFKRSSILNKINLDNFQTSTKIEALREEIRLMIEADGSAKGIVFSQFTSFLDLIKYSLQKSGIQCVQLVGSMSLTSRDDAVRKFSDDPDCRIFLVSLKSGGVALNLTEASYVFLMDPWWNLAAERQAQDRIHRIGQYKPVRIFRFMIENTIEERILQLQEKKELVLERTIGCSSEAMGRPAEEDLKFLFSN